MLTRSMFARREISSVLEYNRRSEFSLLSSSQYSSSFLFSRVYRSTPQRQFMCQLLRVRQLSQTLEGPSQFLESLLNLTDSREFINSHRLSRFRWHSRTIESPATIESVEYREFVAFEILLTSESLSIVKKDLSHVWKVSLNMEYLECLDRVRA